ncbi:MAG: ATPase [Thermodesulfobacteriota bacterium]
MSPLLLADFGTTYSKILELDQGPGEPEIMPSQELAPDLKVDVATGHNGRRHCQRYVNELTALAKGGEALIAESDYVLLDCGSRDIKFVRYENGKIADMGWNAECGASMGFTIELLAHYYDIDYASLAVPAKTFNVICGVLGMSHIFDAITTGASEHEAVARFVKGIAINAYRFAGSPVKIYLSGGLGENPLFVASLPAETVVLGRFVLLAGLEEIARQEQRH